MIDGDEIAEAAGQTLRLDRGRGVLAHDPRPHHDLPVLRALGLRQQRDEGAFQRRLPRLFAEFGGRAGGDRLAVIHRHEPVEALGLLHIGGGDNDAHARAAGADRVDQVPELAARERIDARRRLVEDEQIGIMDQRTAERELLLHAAGQLRGRSGLEGIETRRLEQFVDAAAALSRVLPEEPGVEVDILED